MIKANKFEKNITTTVVIAALCTMGSGVYAQQAVPSTGTSQADTAQYQQNKVQRVHTTDARTVEAGASTGQPTRLNKASGFIGSVVENPQGDRLGKIDEVVLDLNSGRVSYAVLSVEHKMFSTTKYIALPLASLKPSSDGTKLILNADKDKIAQAQGFDRNNWPSVNSPAWGARSPFVGANATPDADVDINAPGYRNPSLNVDTGVNRHPNVDVNVDHDANVDENITASRTVNGNYPDGKPNRNWNTNVIVNSNTNVTTLTKVRGKAYDYQTTNSVSTNSNGFPAGNR